MCGTSRSKRSARSWGVPASSTPSSSTRLACERTKSPWRQLSAGRSNRSVGLWQGQLEQTLAEVATSAGAPAPPQEVTKAEDRHRTIRERIEFAGGVDAYEKLVDFHMGGYYRGEVESTAWVKEHDGQVKRDAKRQRTISKARSLDDNMPKCYMLGIRCNPYFCDAEDRCVFCSP